jgi:hypothetical protein
VLGPAAVTAGVHDPGVIVLAAPIRYDAVHLARVLYRRLREADAVAAAVLIVVPPDDSADEHSMAAAVLDRLRRAETGSSSGARSNS